MDPGAGAGVEGRAGAADCSGFVAPADGRVAWRAALAGPCAGFGVEAGAAVANNTSIAEPVKAAHPWRIPGRIVISDSLPWVFRVRPARGPLRQPTPPWRARPVLCPRRARRRLHDATTIRGPRSRGAPTDSATRRKRPSAGKADAPVSNAGPSCRKSGGAQGKNIRLPGARGPPAVQSAAAGFAAEDSTARNSWPRTFAGCSTSTRRCAASPTKRSPCSRTSPPRA